MKLSILLITLFAVVALTGARRGKPRGKGRAVKHIKELFEAVEKDPSHDKAACLGACADDCEVMLSLTKPETRPTREEMKERRGAVKLCMGCVKESCGRIRPTRPAPSTD